MAFSKAHLYPKEDQTLSHFARALSHPARIAILRQLAAESPCPVVALLKNHPISQPAMSGHLRILSETPFVQSREDFPHTYYTLASDHIVLADQFLRSFFDGL